MDNKITKKRLNDFLSYEWFVILASFLGVVLIIELLFGIFSVKLSVGQEFKFYYDYTVTASIDDQDQSLLYKSLGENKTFSYDVISISSDSISKDDMNFKTKIGVYDGDALFVAKGDDEETDRVKSFIDTFEFNMYNFFDLKEDSKNYLLQFIKDGETEILEENLDQEKINSYFSKRFKNDNRFRSQENKALGLELESQRIKKLVKEYLDFEYLLSVGDHFDIFYRYTRFQQSYDLTVKANGDLKDISAALQAEKSVHGENSIYGIKMDKLTGGAHTPQDYVKASGKTTAEDVVLTFFDFNEVQKDHQIEIISFINTMIKECSQIYNGR